MTVFRFLKKPHNLFLLILLNLLFITTTQAEDKLIFAIDLIRHGDRTPINEIPKSPYAWPQGLGELTAEGMHQEYELGSSLRKKYIDHYHLLPASYSQETIYVKSTDVNRTLMSAESFLLGLYPLGTGPYLSKNKPALPNAFQPIPIHTESKEHGYILGNLHNKEFNPDQTWQKKNNELKSKYKHWSEVSGFEINDLKDLSKLGSALYIRQLHHVPFPAGISKQDAAELITTAQYVSAAPYKQHAITPPPEFFTTIADYFQQAMTQKNNLKYVLFSAHDSTIFSVTSALDAFVDDVPYASDLNFSLFEKNSNQYYVKISFNGKPLSIPTCDNHDVCSISQFMQLVKK